MRIIARATLRDFWERHAAAEQPLKTWFAVTRAAAWKNPVEVKRNFPSADPLAGGRMCFDIANNRYRLIARIDYRFAIVFIRFVGTHKDYDRIDADTV